MLFNSYIYYTHTVHGLWSKVWQQFRREWVAPNFTSQTSPRPLKVNANLLLCSADFSGTLRALNHLNRSARPANMPSAEKDIYMKKSIMLSSCTTHR